MLKSPTALPDELRRFAAGVAAQQILRESAQILTRAGIGVMPLKGVLFQRTLYDDPTQRFSSDVDLLVLPTHFERAVTALLGGGFRLQKVGRSLTEVALSSPRGLAVDLHHRLFGRGRFRLSTHDVFARARRDEQLFGVPVLLASGYDTAAHLVGKLATDHVRADRDARLRELSLVIVQHQLSPDRLAQHLKACGLSRAARYAMGLPAPDPQSRRFFVRTIAAASRDRVGNACAWIARQSVPRSGSHALGCLVAHTLDQSLPWGALSLGWAGSQRLRHARLERARAALGVEWLPVLSPSGRAKAVLI